MASPLQTVIFIVLYGICCAQVVNRAPQWTENLRTRLNDLGLLENTPVGNVIGQLIASDPEGDVITYSTNSEHFEVNANTGEVKLAKNLDNEATQTLPVIFYADDGMGNKVPTSYTVKIIDVNDNEPIFANVPYNARVPENAAIGRTVFSGISVSDLDRGSNGRITLECYVPENDEAAQQACNNFRVREIQVSDGNYTGEVILKQNLDYEVKNRYIMTIKARDGGGFSELATTVNIAIEVDDIQDSPPWFLNAPLSIDVYENTAKDTSVAFISAQDRDTGVPNLLSVRITSSSANKFYLGAVTVDENRVHRADILTSEDIKREEFGEIYQFNIEAVELINGQESAIKTETTVTVTIRDRNDNRPVFDKQEYFVEMDEGLLAPNQIPGFSMQVTDNDSGSNAQFEVRVIDEGVTMGENRIPLVDIWRTVPARGTQNVDVALAVQISGFLDYENPQHRNQVIKVLAVETETEEMFSSTATVYITLRNINDHVPKFSALGYNAAVRENEEVGYLVSTITATDLDSPPFSTITYSIRGTYAQKFNIDTQTGRITLAEQLDYEATQRIEIVLTATDSGGFKADVPLRITVLDHNDQGPVFDASQYKAFVQESRTQFSPTITIHAVDVDSDSPVTYRISEGNTADLAFTIDASTGVLTLRRKLGYEETPGRRGFFELTVEGSDNGIPEQLNTVSVIVMVRDENNHSPVFLSGTYTGTLSEVAGPGTTIVTVEASDNDAGDNAKIRYVMSRGGRDNFVVDVNTGVISVAPNADLDIERFGNQYDITVNAVDMGSPQRTATAQVIVSVTDANNQKPSFSQEVYVFSVNEKEPVNRIISTLTATDTDSTKLLEYIILPETIAVKDRSGNNATQTIKDKYMGAFTVGIRDGIIRVASALKNSEAAEVSFTVEARDINSQTGQQTDTAVVVISIKASDDDGLEFIGTGSGDQPTFTVSVPEETPKETVIMQVVAQDPKTRERITDYREVAGSDPNDYFQIDRESGRVSLNKVLDYDTMNSKQLSFQIEAYTKGPNVRKAMATVIVNVQDINDNVPQFLQAAYSFSISESAMAPQQFGILQATDKDSGASGMLTYSLSGQGASMFRINNVTGAISVAEGVTLDRETVERYDLLVTATDNAGVVGGTKQVASVPLRITLEDENDNIPQFSANPYAMYVLEASPLDTSIGEVFALDRDTGDNGRVAYTIVSGNEDGLFSLITTNAGGSQDQSVGSPTSPTQRIGVIRVAKALTERARGAPYILTVRGEDGGGRGTEVLVEVYIEDAQSQDGKPRFRFPTEDGEVVYMPEEAAEGTNVTQIIGIDRNPNDDRVLSYGFVPSEALKDDMNRFSINPETGVITLREKLDRESKELYELLVVVSDGVEEITRRLFINLTDIDDHQPSFGSCPGEVRDDPQRASVVEEKPAGENVTTVKACDADRFPNNMIYYFIICGNNVSEELGGLKPFRIDIQSGEIFTQVRLDHEVKARYMLCVLASSTPEPNITTSTTTERKKRQTEVEKVVVTTGGDIINVEVNVEDIDDNGPRFGASTGGGQDIVTGVSAHARVGTEVIRIQANDPDTGIGGSDFSPMRYSLSELAFYGGNSGNDYRQAKDAFTIDAVSGAVVTNLVSYMDYVDGYFQMTVTAVDNKERQAAAQLYIYVVRESQSLRFVFDKSPEEVKDIYQKFMSDVQKFFPTVDLNADGMRYHIVPFGDGQVDMDMTDLCFHMVKDKKVLNTDTGLKMFDDQEDNKPLQALFYTNDVKTIRICQVKMTTRWWSGHWWYWWILIALALLILLSTLIHICCMCYCWKRFQKNTYYRGRPRPYIVLDPVGIPNGTTPSEYEWQQEVVKMD